MCFFRRHKVARPIAVILHGLFLAVLTLALQPRVFDPFEDRLPIKASKLVALSDLIPRAAFHRGFKSSQTESRTVFSLAKIYQPIDLHGVSIIDSQRIHVPYQRPVDASRLIRAPPLPSLV
jgi:hypothetical protein